MTNRILFFFGLLSHSSALLIVTKTVWQIMRGVNQIEAKQKLNFYLIVFAWASVTSKIMFVDLIRVRKERKSFRFCTKLHFTFNESIFDFRINLFFYLKTSFTSNFAENYLNNQKLIRLFRFFLSYSSNAFLARLSFYVHYRII